MRPVNLIPPEERRGERAPSRTGAIPYMVIGSLALALVAVVAVVLTNNQISDKKAEVTSLDAQEADARARAEALRPYADFATMAAARDATVTSLAESRFDWERVLNELALVIPSDVWLIKATGTAGPDVQVENAVDIPTRDGVSGPALELVGCGTGQEAVASFAAALRDIDGVTRIGVHASERPDQSSGTTAGAAGASGDLNDCRTRDFITRFEIVASFDAVPVPEVPTAPPLGATPAPAAAEPAPEIADAQAQEQEARDETAEQSDQASEATNLIPGVAQ